MGTKTSLKDTSFIASGGRSYNVGSGQQRSAPEGIPSGRAQQPIDLGPIDLGFDFTGVNLNDFMGGRADTGLIDSGGGYIAPNS